MTNPYGPPATPDAPPLPRPARNSLRPLWIWLAVALAGSMLATPADIFRILPAFVFGLPCFLFGAIIGSTLKTSAKLLALLPLVLSAAFLWHHVWWPLDVFFVAVAFIYVGLSVWLGVRASWALVERRRQILTWFSVGYLGGIILGPLGSIVASALAAVIANRYGGEA